MMAWTSLTAPQNMFLEASSRALMTIIKETVKLVYYTRGRKSVRMAKPGRIKTTPADEMAE